MKPFRAAVYRICTLQRPERSIINVDFEQLTVYANNRSHPKIPRPPGTPLLLSVFILTLNVSDSASAGTYTEVITMESGVEVYGGFFGDETLFSERDPAANITIIDVSSPAASVKYHAVIFSLVTNLARRIHHHRRRGGMKGHR